MKYIGSFLFVFILIYLVYFLFVINRKEKVKLIKNNSIYKYLVKVYNLDTKKLNDKMMANIIALTTSFIIALTFSIVLILDDYLLQLLLAVGVLILLQIFIYMIIGKWLKRREKNV